MSTTIAQLPVAAPISDSDLIPVAQGSVDAARATASALATYAATAMGSPTFNTAARRSAQAGLGLAIRAQYATYAAMVADASGMVSVGDTVQVLAGFGNAIEAFSVVAAATLTPTGTLVQNLTGSGLQAVSLRLDFASSAEFTSDPRTNPAGCVVRIPSEGKSYIQSGSGTTLNAAAQPYALIADTVQTAAATTTNAANVSINTAAISALQSISAAGMVPTAGGPVAFATTGNVTLSGALTADGYTALNADRVLVLAQTAPAQNGIYIVNTAGAWTRATDMNAGSEFKYASVFVTNGTVNGGRTFYCPSTVVTVGTDPVSFVQVANQSVLAASVATLQYASPFMPGADTRLQCVRALVLTGANTSKLYHVKYLFWNDSGTRFNCTISQSDDGLGLNVVDVASFASSGITTYAGRVEFTLAQISGSGITGALVLDLTGLSSITINLAPVTAADYQKRQIRPDSLFSSATMTAYLQSVSAPLAANTKLPFADTVSNPPLQNIFRDFWAYGCNQTHAYEISTVSLQSPAGTPSLVINFSDVTAGAIVAQYNLVAPSPMSIAAFQATIPTSIKGIDYFLGTKSGIFFVAVINPAVIPTANNSYAGAASCRINTTRCLGVDQVKDYLDRDFAHKSVSVGATGDYTTLRAAIEAYQVLPTDHTYPPSVQSNYAHYNNRIRFNLIDDATYNATDLTLFDFGEIRGNGIGRTIIQPENTNPHPLIQGHRNLKASDLTLYSTTGNGTTDLGQYAWHSDDVNTYCPAGKTQNQVIRQLFERVEFRAGPLQNVSAFGCGISSGQRIIFRDCYAAHENPALSGVPAAFLFHNTGPTIGSPSIASSYKPSGVSMTGVGCSDTYGAVVYVQSLQAGPKCTLELRDCDFELVVQDIASGEVTTDLASDRFGWAIVGNHSGPIQQNDPDGAWVLATTPGATVSGSLAALIFGTGPIDELGRGTKWINPATGAVYSLGARIGDCSVTSQSLTIGAQTCTFTTNVSAQPNATILATINAALSANPVSLVDVRLETFPDAGFKRKMLNSTGSTIPAGIFVKRTGANTIAPAASGDAIFGWTYRAIVNGARGSVMTTQAIAQPYITGAASSTGPWGIVTGGALTFGATPVLGTVQNGIVTVF